MIRLLRLEALALALALAVTLYLMQPAWWLVVLVLLLPDLAMAGYLAGPVVGAILYNLAHSVIGPVLLLGLAVLSGSDMWQQVALIWALHIAIDRAIGYGLKSYAGFQQTHLGRIGK